jgi:hypothetical protein
MWALERRNETVWCKRNGVQGSRGNIVKICVTNVFADMIRRQAKHYSVNVVGVSVLNNCTQWYCLEELRLVRLVKEFADAKMFGNWVAREMLVSEREDVRVRGRGSCILRAVTVCIVHSTLLGL